MVGVQLSLALRNLFCFSSWLMLAEGVRCGCLQGAVGRGGLWGVLISKDGTEKTTFALDLKGTTFRLVLTPQ